MPPTPVTPLERPRQRLLPGAARVFVAEMIVIPTGILTVAFLTRKLGPAGYGMLAVAAAFIDWLEWGITASFSRATVKFVSEASDWRPVASRAIQLQLFVSICAGLLLVLLAGPIALLMREPDLAWLLRLYAIDLPVFCLAQAHRDVLVGLGLYKERAIASGWRWIARLAIIVALVSLGMSIEGAIIGGIASSLVELAICRWYVAPGLFSRPTFSARPLLVYIAPLSLYAVGVKLYDKLDLVTFKALGGTAAAAGLYGGAESLTALPAMIATAFAPMLLSSLGEATKAGDLGLAKARARKALGAMLLMLPLAGMLPAMSEELVVAMYGRQFAPAAPLFEIMNLGAIAMFVIAVSTSIMVAAGRPGWTGRIMGPLVLLQLVGNLLMIPRFGSIGAAWVTTGCAVAGCIACLVVVHRMWGVVPPLGTFLRGVAIAGACWGIATVWPTPGPLVFAKFFGLSAACMLAFWVFGDLPGSRKGGLLRLPGRRERGDLRDAA